MNDQISGFLAKPPMMRSCKLSITVFGLNPSAGLIIRNKILVQRIGLLNTGHHLHYDVFTLKDNA